MILISKFDIGDKVFEGQARLTQTSIPCDFCEGTGKRDVPSATQGTITRRVPCPKCKGAREFPGPPAFTISVVELTIGEVRITDGRQGREEQYMCEETGIGSGRLYDADKITSTEEDARILARAQGVREVADALQRGREQAIQRDGFKCKNCGHRRSAHFTYDHQPRRCQPWDEECSCETYDPDHDERKTSVPAPTVEVTYDR